MNENIRKIVLRILHDEQNYKFENKLELYYEQIYKLNFNRIDHCFIHWNAINFDDEVKITHKK